MMRAVCAALLFLAAWPFDGRAQTVVHDDFQGADFSPTNWFVCKRDENDLSVVKRPGGGRAAQLVAHPVKPRVLGLREFLARERHGGCRGADGNFTPDGTQRAELWEKRELVQPAGTETWIQFEFMVVSPPAGAVVPHLVIGQLKLDGGRSPVLAQRFTGRQFVVSIEQDNESPGRSPDKKDCRITVAHDASLRAPFASSVGHDARDVERKPAKSSGVHGVSGCKSDVTVDAREFLPSPFDKWVRMTYRVKPGIKDGLLEVWADGKLIAKAAGRIGHRDSMAGSQYFKFGPYSIAPPPYDIRAYLARYRRAPTCAQLGNPSAPECLAK